MVLAKDTCDSDDIVIQSILLENSSGHLEELREASVSNQKIDLGLKMDVVGDSAQYKIVVKNNSDEDYYFDERALNIDIDSVNYEISFDDNTSLIKAEEEKVVYLKVSYKEQMDATNFNNGLYDGTQVMKLDIMTLENPYTGRFLGLFMFTSLLIGFFVLYRDKKKTAYLLLLISFTIPFSVKAVCRHSLEVNTNLVIDARNAIFLPGKEFNIKVKQLVGDDTSTATYGYDFKDEFITAFHYSDVEPIDSNKEDKNIVSSSESNYPIYVWFDNGTLYWWSEDMTPSLNEDASLMLTYFTKLEDVTGVKNFDSSIATSLKGFFFYSDIRTADDLVQWNTSNVESLMTFFKYNDKLASVNGVKYWDVRKVQNMDEMFRGCFSLEEIDLSHWETPSLTAIGNMFGMTRKSGVLIKSVTLKRIILSDKFNTSKVKYIAATFSGCYGIEDWSFLRFLDTSSVTDMNLAFGYSSFNDTSYISHWDVSNVLYFQYLFMRCDKLTSLAGLRNWNTENVKGMGLMFYQNSFDSVEPIKNWNTSNVTDMSYLFYECKNLQSIDTLNWDTSNVTSMSYMFNGCTSLKDVYGISSWNTSNVTDMSYMFSASPNLEEVDISSFDTRNVTNFARMFNGSTKLNHIYVGDKWDISANTSEATYVFPTTSNLPNFSNTNPSYRNLSYAHTGEGGYLTLKTD